MKNNAIYGSWSERQGIFTYVLVFTSSGTLFESIIVLIVGYIPTTYTCQILDLSGSWHLNKDFTVRFIITLSTTDSLFEGQVVVEGEICFNKINLD